MTTCLQRRPEPGDYLACDVHGRLVRREHVQYYDGPVWLCVGFDGEAAGWCTAGPVPEDARRRLLAGETYWPGVVTVREEPDPLDTSQAVH